MSLSELRWLVVSLRASVPADLESLGFFLMEAGAVGVEERGGTLLAYFPGPENEGPLLKGLHEEMALRAGSGGVEISWWWQEQEEWATLWRRGLAPRQITPRLGVTPTWEGAPPPLPGVRWVRLDPGMAFGTGEHATTRGCLRLLDRLLSPGERVADVGAGSGILSISAALLGAGGVTAFECDEVACQVARENARLNGVAEAVAIRHETVEGEVPLPGGPYHGILANLQRSLLVPLLSSFSRSLLPGGWVVVSGMLEEEREELLGAAEGRGFSLAEEDREEGWWSGAFRWDQGSLPQGRWGAAPAEGHPEEPHPPGAEGPMPAGASAPERHGGSSGGRRQEDPRQSVHLPSRSDPAGHGGRGFLIQP